MGSVLDRSGNAGQIVASDARLQTRLFFRLLPYQFLLIVINAVKCIVDSLHASNFLGKAAMTAIGLYNPMNHFLYAASMMLVSGSQMLYGRYLTKDREHIQSVISVDLMSSLLLSLATSAALVLAVITNLTSTMVWEPEELMMFNQYLLGNAIGIPALVLGQQFFAFLSLENQTKRTMTASIVCLVVNAAADYLFIAVLKMGTFGLGLASSLANLIFLGIQAAYYIQGKSQWRITLRGCKWGDSLQIVKLGYPGALTRFMEMIRCLIVNELVLIHVSSVGLSAFAASNSLLSVVWALPFGMVAVCRMLLSISYGEEDRRTMVDVMKITNSLCILIMVVVAVVISLLADPLTRLFYRDVNDPVFHMTLMGFRLLPMCMPLAMVSLSFACYAQVTEKRGLSIVLPIVDGMVGVVLFSFLLIPRLGMNGLYIANILNGVLCFIVIAVAAWLSLKRCPRSFEDLLAIPENFGVGDDARIDITVRDTKGVVEVSRRVNDFCLERGVDRRKAFHAGLALEEMASNVILHGFTKDNKSHSLDIRVVHSGEDVIMRLRDDCRAFNPVQHLNLLESSKSFQGIGIRMVYSMVRDVHYENLLGTNVLTLRI